jgi:putative peptidoglycan lipid II flippase
LTLLLTMPCLVAFLLVPDLIMRALFMRGAFTAADASAAGATLAAYAVGLIPFVLVRSASATFLARGDTVTPVKALFVGVAVNVALKVLLMDRFAQVGLAFATSVGAWVNLALLIWFAARQKLIEVDERLRQALWRLAIAGAALALALWLGQSLIVKALVGWSSLRDETTLALLAAFGGLVYGGAVIALFGPQWLAALRGRMKSTALPDPD